jgi:hypothetical protein
MRYLHRVLAPAVRGFGPPACGHWRPPATGRDEPVDDGIPRWRLDPAHTRDYGASIDRQ